MDLGEEIITAIAEEAVVRALTTLGISSGEISQRRARDIYGKWFVDAVNSGRITPCRVDNGRNGTKHYRVADILTVKANDLAQAEVIIRDTKK